MNTEFLTNGDDDEVNVPNFWKDRLDLHYKAVEQLRKDHNMKQLVFPLPEDKPTCNKEYSDKMKQYLEERKKK